MMMVEFKLGRWMLMWLCCDCYEIEKEKKKKRRKKWNRKDRKRKRKIEKALKKEKQKRVWNNVVLISDVCWCETCDK